MSKVRLYISFSNRLVPKIKLEWIVIILLQKVIRHKRVTLVLDGVRARALNTHQQDPLLLINFPDVDHQFKVK